MGMETLESCKHLGLHLEKTIEDTLEITMRNTEPKRIKEDSKVPHLPQICYTEHCSTTLS
jgi:hypothetical protein